MTAHIVRLGSSRQPDEGLRIGTVRRPPRGVPKSEYAARDWYDVWLPDLAPSVETLAVGRAARSPQEWESFLRRFGREMRAPAAARLLDLLAALSHHADFAVGCYCADETRCHRSVLRYLLAARGARLG